MKTTKRSKMLLSSIAMLLVALVALGSASFAWYYNQTTVTANDATVAAAAAQGLEIKHKAGGTWTTAITFDQGGSLPNASTNFASASGSLIGAKGGVGTAYDDGTLNSALTYIAAADIKTDGAIYYDDAYVRSTSTDVTAYTKVTVTGADDTYLIFLVYVNGSLIGAYSSDSKSGAPTTATKIKYESNAVSSDGTANVKVPGTYKNEGTSFTALAGDTGTHVEVFAFVDGYNAKCTTKTANVTACDVDLAFSTTQWS